MAGALCSIHVKPKKGPLSQAVTATRGDNLGSACHASHGASLHEDRDLNSSVPCCELCFLATGLLFCNVFDVRQTVIS